MSSQNKDTVSGSLSFVAGAAGLLAMVVGFSSATSAAIAAPSVEDLGWLAGDWVSAEGAGPTFETHYGTAAGGILMGQMRMLDGETLAFYEFETFKVEDGVLKVSPLPFGQPGVTFDAVLVEPGHARFENPANGFPSVIEYKLLPDGSLWSLAEGIENGTPQRIEYVQSRVGR